MTVLVGVGARSTTPFAIHFSKTDLLIPLAAAKSSFDMVAEVLIARAFSTALFTAALRAGISAEAILAIRSDAWNKSKAFSLFAFSVCITQYLLWVVLFYGVSCGVIHPRSSNGV